MGGPSTSGSAGFRRPSSVTHQPTEGQPRLVGTDGDPGLPELILRGPTAGAAPCSTIRSPHDSALDRAKREHHTAGFRGGDKCVFLRKRGLNALRALRCHRPRRRVIQYAPVFTGLRFRGATSERAGTTDARAGTTENCLPLQLLPARSARPRPSPASCRTRRRAAGTSCRSRAPRRSARPARGAARGGCGRRPSRASRPVMSTGRARRG